LAPVLGTLSWSTRFSRRPGSRRYSVLKFNSGRDIPPETIEYIFEEGDIGKGLLINVLRASKHPVPAFSYKKDTRMRNGGVRRAFLPLQAADLLANELFQQVKTSDLTRPVLSYRELENMPGHLSVVTPDMVDQYVAFLRDPECEGGLRIGW
jgi:hypothetical protein